MQRPSRPLPHPRRRPSRPCPAHPGSSWARALLVAVLGALLLVSVHCSTSLLGEGPRHGASFTAPATGPEPDGPGHPRQEHGSACASPGLTPKAPGGTHLDADAAGTLTLTAAADQPSAATAPSAPPCADGAPIPRSGRSTLTSVCRWRI